MPAIDINDIATIGSVSGSDTPDYMLPPEAWTIALNMRYRDEGLETLGGWQQVFGTPTVAPHHLLAVTNGGTRYWVYCSLTHAYVYDGSAHTQITRAAGATPYTATQSREWNSTLLAGIPILNNGIDVPQFWSPVSAAQDLQNLTNWNANVRAKVIRAFGPFLMAFNITDTGTSYPHAVRWSHPAVPGAVPTSWDPTDQTVDTGEVDLSDIAAGVILDALPLGEQMYVYKEASVRKVRYVGGRTIFDFGQNAWLPTTGLLAARCVAVTGDGLKQVFASQDDIIWHDGNKVQSVLDKRQRRRLFNEIDTTNFNNSFMFCHPARSEMYFCYPSSGNTNPNRALVMNYSRGDQFVITEMDGITFRHAASGPMEAATAETWASASGTWDTDPEAWAQQQRRQTLLAGTDATKIFQFDNVETRDGATFTSQLRRTGLGLIGRKRDGSPIVDHQRRKMFTRLWPKVRGSSSVNVRFVGQEVVNGALAWSDVASFDPASQTFCDPGPVSGRAVGFEMYSTGSWGLDGYKIDIQPLGEH